MQRDPRALLTQPQQAKVDGPSRHSTTSLQQHRPRPAAQSLRGLTPPMRGGANASRPCAATRARRTMDHLVWPARWPWATRRHPQKPAPWVAQRAVRTVGHRQGVFAAGHAHILWYQGTPIPRLPQGKGHASPLPPALTTSWEQRAQWRRKPRTIATHSQSLLPAQDWRGGLCKTLLYDGDPLDEHPSTPTQPGGEDRTENRMGVPQWGHHAHHQRHGYKAAGA